MAQAIQCVHHCIQSKGGNVYNSLSQRDIKWVDDLHGMEDGERIQEVVKESMEREEKGKAMRLIGGLV